MNLLFLALLVQPADLLTQLRASDPVVRLSAVQQAERLGAEGSPDAIYLVPLARLLADSDAQTRGLAALALSRHIGACQGRAPEGLVEPLIRALGDDNPHLGAYCGRTLAVLGDRALAEITAGLDAARPRVGRLAALHACRHLATNPNARPAVAAILWRFLSDSDDAVRERACMLVRELRADALRGVRDRDQLAAVLRVEEPRIRALAVLRLTALETEAFPLLADLLDDPTPLVRTGAATALERLLDLGLEPEETLVLTLLRRLETEKNPEAANLHGTLSGLIRDRAPAPDAVVAVVDEALAEASKVIPFGDLTSVFEVLKPVEGDAVKVLTERLAASDPKIQATASDAFRRLCVSRQQASPAKTLRYLAIALRSPHPATAQEAALTLGLLLRPAFEIPPALLIALRSGLLRGDPLLRLACTEALAACGLQAEALLTSLLRHPDSNIQQHAALAVSLMVERFQSVPGETAEELRHLCQSPDARVRQAASRALAALEDPVLARQNRADAVARIDPEVHQQVRRQITALARGNAGSGLLLLAKLLAATDPATWPLATEALGRQIEALPGNPSEGMLFTLANRLTEKDPDVRTASWRALEALGDRIVPQMRSAVDPKRPRDQRLEGARRIRLMLGVSSLRSRARLLLWELLADSDPVLRERVGTTFGAIRNDELGPLEEGEIERIVNVLRMPEPEFRKLAANHLGILGAKTLPLLLPLLDDDNLFARAEVDHLLRGYRRYLSPEQVGQVLLAVVRRSKSEAPELHRALDSPEADWEDRRVQFAALEPRLKSLPIRLPEPVTTVDPTLTFTLTLAGASPPEELLARLRSDSERWRALWRIEQLGREGAVEAAYVPALARLLLEPATRLAAAQALVHHIRACRGNVPEPVVLALLLARREAEVSTFRHPQTEDEASAVTACRQALATLRETAWTLDDLVSYRDARVREAAAILEVARMLNDRKAAFRALTILGSVLVGPDVETCRAAALAVAQALQPGVRVPSDVLLGLRLGIKGDDANLRRACIEALAACGPQAEDSLCALLESRDVEVQRRAVEAILLMLQRTRYAPRLTVPQLLSLAETNDEGLREKIQDALMGIERTPEGDKHP
jgi:hypothetical protein